MDRRNVRSELQAVQRQCPLTAARGFRDPGEGSWSRPPQTAAACYWVLLFCISKHIDGSPLRPLPPEIHWSNALLFNLYWLREAWSHMFHGPQKHFAYNQQGTNAELHCETHSWPSCSNGLSERQEECFTFNVQISKDHISNMPTRFDTKQKAKKLK